MSHTRAAVIGAGAMGAGIAQVLAAASVDVLLMDIKTEFVENGLKKIAGKFASDVKKGKLTEEEKASILSRIKGTIEQKEAATSDLIIEAIIEDRKVKADLFQSLDRVCPPETVFATNTSTLSVTDLGALSGRPERFLGLHFFNPVPAMKLVEVIPGLNTCREAVDTAAAVMRSAKKMPVTVQDCPGFLVNRILLMYVVEAFVCVEEGVPPEEIDAKARGAGFPMGPLELSDMVGLDVSLHTMPVLHEAYGGRFPFPELVKKLNDAGRLGLKTGKGIYTEGKVDDQFRALTGSAKSTTPFTADRCVLRAVNEAIYCLQEGVASADDIDRAMVLGTGFPAQGPLHWADEKGLDWVLAALLDLSANVSPSRFWPHHLLKQYVAAGRLGRKTGKGFFSTDIKERI